MPFRLQAVQRAGMLCFLPFDSVSFFFFFTLFAMFHSPKHLINSALSA